MMVIFLLSIPTPTNQPTNPILDIPDYCPSLPVSDEQGGDDEQHVLLPGLAWRVAVITGEQYQCCTNTRCDNNKLATTAIIISQVQLTHHPTPGPASPAN